MQDSRNDLCLSQLQTRSQTQKCTTCFFCSILLNITFWQSEVQYYWTGVVLSGNPLSGNRIRSVTQILVKPKFQLRLFSAVKNNCLLQISGSWQALKMRRVPMLRCAQIDTFYYIEKNSKHVFSLLTRNACDWPFLYRIFRSQVLCPQKTFRTTNHTVF